MGFLLFLGGFLTAVLLIVGAFTMYCLGVATADERKSKFAKSEEPDVALYNDDTEVN